MTTALSDRPDQAVILAAGLGSRLRPVTVYTPKPLVPFFGRPLLDWAVGAALRAGVTRIAVNAHHLADQVADRVQLLARRHPKVEFFVSRETELLGTGGAVRALADAGWLDRDHFWVINSDAVFDAPLTSLRFASAPALMVTRAPEHRHLRRLVVDAAGLLVGLDESAPESGVAFCGVTLADARLPERLPRGPSCILRQGILPFLPEFSVTTVSVPGFYADTGTPALLADAHVRGAAFAASRERFGV